MEIIEPTLLLDKEKCRYNIRTMVRKAEDLGVILRPHFKTHQSLEIGGWFRQAGVDRITVSSLRMAKYFADDGWDDISVAIPVNLREMDRINLLAADVKLNLLVESADVVTRLSEELKNRVGLFIKIDTGYGRTGISAGDTDGIENVLQAIASSDRLAFAGFLTHTGHTYHAKNATEVKKITTAALHELSSLKSVYRKRFPEMVISMGDTPGCSLATTFDPADEIRPGNFVFYDLMQASIGACTADQIAVAMACPVIARHDQRSEVVIYGGAVHFSKEYLLSRENEKVFGHPVIMRKNGWSQPHYCCYLKSVSQEHGILKMCPEHYQESRPGDLVYILPVHSCLTANLMHYYYTLDGRVIPHL